MSNILIILIYHCHEPLGLWMLSWAWQNVICGFPVDWEDFLLIISRSFWNLMNNNKYRNPRKAPSCLISFFSSTYVNQLPWLNIIMSKYCFCLTDNHLKPCLRLGVNNYILVLKFTKLVDSMQCIISYIFLIQYAFHWHRTVFWKYSLIFTLVKFHIRAYIQAGVNFEI